MNDKTLVKTSKYLARHLRHAPEDIGLTLQPGGWVEVTDLLTACAKAWTRDQPCGVGNRGAKQR